MTVYASNLNGDWWAITAPSATEIIVLDSEDEEIKAAMEEYEVEEGEDGWGDFILAEGKEISFYSDIREMLKE